MKINENDWRITAYALGELEGDDLAAVEAAVAESAELRAIVDEVRAAAAVISKELEGEPTIALTGAQRARIEERAGGGGAASGRSGTLGRFWVYSGAIAACLAVAFGAWSVFVPSLSRARELSKGMMQRLAMNTPTERDEMRASMKGELGDDRGSNVAARHSVARRKGGRKLAKKGKMKGPSSGTIAVYAKTDSIEDDALRALVHDTLHPPDFGETAPAVDLQNARASTSRKVRRGRRSIDPKNRGDAAFGGNYLIGGNIEGLKDEREGGGAGSETVRDLRFTNYGKSPEGKLVPLASMRDRVGDERQRLIVGASRRNLGPSESPGIESYAPILENPFLFADQSPLSTFSIDVDTASYSNVRRFLNNGSLPPADSVRIEELVNYFDYDYPLPIGEHPFSVYVEMADCPWDAGHRLARIGIKGMEYTPDERPAANLVFLIDVSGSMGQPNKLPLLQESLSMLVDELGRDDWVSMVVYAGASGLALPSTSCGNKDSIRSALNGLRSGGSTNGGAGIQLAYNVAEDNFIEGGINRVILATDGDFNVGTTGQGELTRLIEEKAKGGVFLSVLGFGMGNLKDATLEMLADKGNGNYAYIDSQSEARKVLVDQLAGTLITIAKDVKIQVEFNPAEVAAYRLIGYENRMLAAQDFNDDKKDAGEIGAGHTVTAFYEIIPVGGEVDLPTVDPLKYQKPASGEATEVASSGELMTVKIRYKLPDEDVSSLIEFPVIDDGATFAESSDDFAFASAVASFGMLLRHSQSCNDLTFEDVIEIAEGGVGDDAFGYRAEFIDLVRKANRFPFTRGD